MSGDRGFRSIGEVLAEVQDEFPDITISKIRFLESQGLIDPERTQAGYRKFYPHDVERLRFILRSQKEAYLPLRVIRDRLGTGDTSMSGTIPIDVDPTVTEPIITDPIVTDPIVADPIVADERVPVWMKDHAANTALPPTPHAQPVTALALSSNEVSLNAAELERAAGIDATLRLELEAYRLIAPRLVAGEAVYGDDALIIARTAASFAQLGIEPRHLRMFKAAADKEVAVYEQLILPLLKQRNPQARADAADRLRALNELSERMHTVLVASLLRQVGDL